MKAPHETLAAIASGSALDRAEREARAADPVARALRAELAIVVREMEAETMLRWIHVKGEGPKMEKHGALWLVSALVEALGYYMTCARDPLDPLSYLQIKERPADSIETVREVNEARAVARRLAKRLRRDPSCVPADLPLPRQLKIDCQAAGQHEDGGALHPGATCTRCAPWPEGSATT